MRVLYPSSDFPAPPAFSVSVPDGWTASAEGFADMVLAAPDPVDGVNENLVVKYRRVDPLSPAEQVLDQMVEAVSEDDGVEVRALDRVVSEGGPLARIMVCRTFQETPIFQDHAVLHLHRGRAAFVLSITATVADNQEAAARAKALVESLRVDPASSNEPADPEA